MGKKLGAVTTHGKKTYLDCLTATENYVQNKNCLFLTV